MAKSTNEEIVRQCFAIFDQDKNGVITMNEFMVNNAMYRVKASFSTLPRKSVGSRMNWRSMFLMSWTFLPMDI